MPFSFVNAQIVIGGSVYGGGNAGDTGGSTTVTVRAGDINEVFGGARMADVKGSAFVHFDGEHAADSMVINKVYGGNDIAGTIGSKAESKVLPDELTEKTENEIDNTWDAFVRISTKTTTDADGNVVEVEKAPKIYIGQLFAGGNGDYTYTTEANANGDYLAKDGDAVVATSKSPITKPELNKTYLEVLGGSIVYAYGGGNNATIKESSVICMDNPSKVVNSILDKNGNELLTAARFKDQMGINTGLSYPGSDEFQIGRFFGGNNKAEMAIRPVWNLKSGKIRNLYSGGNKGAMTSAEGLFLEIAEGSKIIIDNVYGGCRMADVHPLQSGTLESGVYVESKSDEIDLKIPGYTFPKGLSARVVINGGDINNVYGGNDVTGKVYGGNAVGIHTSIRGDVFGGGNGSYPYTDNPKLEGDDIYGDMYYDPSGYDSSVDALNAYRPNAEQVSLRLIGKEGAPTVIHGSVYCGGNSATIASTKEKPMVELKIGSYVIADNVFLGNNGANMVTTNEEETDDQGLMTKREGTLRTLVRTDIASDHSKFNSMDLTDATTFAKYMEGAAMSLMPSVVFDEQPTDPVTYIPYSSSIGSFFCGGNVGSMTTAGKTSIEFDNQIIIYDKVVGGCNNANVAATDFNAAYEGGLIGDAAPAPEGKIGDKLELTFKGLRIQPKRWKDDTKTELIWNTISASTGKDVAPVTTGTNVQSDDADLDRRLKGGNIYGGCYNTGHVNGNVIINLDSAIVDHKGDFAIFDKVEENEGEAILYGNDSYKILERRSGVILDEQGMDVLGKALNVFGGGYGPESEIWGSTTINLNTGYTFQIFGGGEQGPVGKPSDDGNYTYQYKVGNEVRTKKFKYDPNYSCYVNMRGKTEGVYRGHDGDSNEMAEAEFIYGGAFEAPIAGNTVINLGNGRVFNTFAGSCNADILGHTETYIGRQKKEDGTYEDGGGFPWIRDHLYGGNDLGGRIMGKENFMDRVSADIKSTIYNSKGKEVPDVVNASAYMEYIQGRVDNVFGGCYGDYDYTDRYFEEFTDENGMDKPGFTKPRLDNAFVYFHPNTHTRNVMNKIFGAGQGKLKGVEVDLMQNRSYVLVDIPQTIMKFQNVEVFGAGANCGLGMGVKQIADATPDGKSIAENPDNASAIIDLVRGQISAAYGGSFEEGITRRTVVNVPNGSTISLNNIFGGAYGADPMYPCDVYEAQVNYNSESARVKTIYGGNNSADRTLYGQVNIGAPVWQNKESGYLATVFGAGYGKDTWSQYTEVNLNSGARVYEVYGGGNSGKVLNLESLRKWRHDEGASLDLSLPGYETSTTYTDKDGNEFHLDAGLESPLAHAVSLDGQKYNTNVHIHQGATVVNYAYGGGLGADADVSGTTYIDLLGGTVNKDIYAGGTSGAVQDYYKVGAKSDSNPYGFTASATAYIEGGTVRNVYGGGWEGDVGYHDKSVTETTNDIPGMTNVVIGIRKDQATLPDGYGFLKGVPAIQRSAYAGGEGGSIFGEAHVTVNNGYIGYFYDADSKDYVAKVDDETWSDHVGKDRLSDCGNVFGGGYDDNSSVDESFVTIWGGVIRNSVFGGGEIATIGRGKVTESGDDNKTREVSDIYKFGGTNITIYNGQIKRNVFGGGKGYNILGYGGIHGFYTDGYVFGQTKVYIHGGEIGTDEGLADGYGNVFGGGDVGFVYGKGYFSPKTLEKNPTESPGHIYYYDNDGKLTEDCKVVIAPMLQLKPGKSASYKGVDYGAYDYVPTEYLNTLPADKTDSRWTDLYTGDKLADGSVNPEDPEERGIQIHNAVFAGGNVSSNSESYANATTIFGNTTATLYDVYHHDFITVGTEHTGGLYGGGNLSVVGGYRELNITNYGTDYYGLDQQITLDEYRMLTNRERAYFKLEYLCQQDVTINGKSYNAGDRISEDDYNALPAEYRNETYWVQYGFCSIYAGRLLNTIQRADFCGVFGSRLVLQGAKDRVADVADATEYTINRIGELSLNQQRFTPGSDDEIHGNYFGIYSIVNYLGNLTSDVRFVSDKRRYVDKGQVKEDTQTYYDWKVEHLTKRDRNNGTSWNQVALASGVFLELTTENSTPSKKVYGDITGVVELDLINVKKDIEGGGYVYARNEHGQWKEISHENTLLSSYNMKDGDEALTKKIYTYSTTELFPYQTSGNFIHKSKRIVDDCYPNNGIYNDGYTKSPAHYWFIKGEVYIYDQVVSAYAGSASAYSKEVKIPLTITAGSNGRLKLLNVQPNLYAYYADENRSESNKVGEDGVKVDNESVTYHLNDVISWWDWHQLADNEQKYFVKETVVNVDTCVINGVEYPSGTYVLENDLSAHASEVEPKTAYQHFMELHPNVYDKSGKLIEDLNALFHPSNNIAHGSGYALTLDMNSPKDWDDWYSPKNGETYYTVDGGVVNTNRQRKDAYEALSAAQKELYREGPTYTLMGESGLYGQREYGKGEIISKEVYVDYTSTVGKMAQQPEGQADAEPAYVATADFGTTQAGNAISQSEYNALADKSNFDPAMVCINTIQLGDEEYVLLGELVSGTSANLTDLATKYMNYNNSKINADKIDLAQAQEYIHANLSDAYYITKDGLYGGQYYEAGENYGAIKSWCTLTDARDKFNYNYDALDLLVDPLYRGEGYIEDSYHSPYSDVKSVEYEAVYGGADMLTYYDVSGAKHTIASGNSIPREEYEQVRNDQMHYTRVQVEAGTDNQTVYIVMDNIINNGTPYAKGQDISEKDYKSLSSINKEKVNIVNFKKGSTASVKYYCYEPYTPAKTFATEVGAPGAVGSVVADIIFNSDDVPNYQKFFTIQGSEPTETTTLYVSRESNAKDVTSEKVISVVYQYTYYESDDEGEGVSLVNELHVLNIHLQLESGAPEIGLLNAPPAVLPGNSVGLKAPTVNPGLYEILTSGWELFFSEEDAMLHRNGVPFVNNGTPLYWYQNQKVFLAFYSKTYLGKTYSNYVPLTVANYHDIDAIMKDKEHHLYVDHPDVMRNSKIYIDNRTCESDPTKSELDLLKDFFDLSMLSGPAAAGSALDGHANLDPHVAGGADLEFILNSNVSPKAYSVAGGSPTGWTPIGDATRCFAGNLHGDGYTISGLNNSLFGNLCGAVYNLGVTGDFTSAGIVDTGDGYVESCWINTSATSGFGAGTRAVFGNPSAKDDRKQIVNCYYPETKPYNTTNNGRGLAHPMSEKAFYNGTVAYDLNGFYLNKRYYDHEVPGGSPVEYTYLKQNADGTLEEETSTGRYPSSYAFYPLDEHKSGQYGYVEDRYADGDFVYSGGTVPESYDERMRVIHDGATTSVVYSPIWPDDYIYFGQMLTYDYNTTLPHEEQPSRIAKSGGRVVNNSQSNRVYRAPAYYRSNKQDVAHFNNIAYLVANSKPESVTSTDVKEAYPNMTAIDFAGHNDTQYKQGLNGDFFFQPLLDIEDNLLDIVNEGETQNLLVYAPSAEEKPVTHTVLSTYFIDPPYASYYVDDNSRAVKEAPTASVHGHLVQNDLTAACDHLLVDKQDFNAPIAYTFDEAHRMWYQRKPDRYVDTSKGWESVSLPFTAELVTTHQKGEITHFYSGSKSIDANSETKIGHEYWLRELTGLTTDASGEATGFFNYPDDTGKEAKMATNTFLWDYYYSNSGQKDVNNDMYQQFYSSARAYAKYPYVQCATPYLIGFPGVTYYEFDLSGNFKAKGTASPAPIRLDQQVITFAAKTGETVEVTDHELEEGAVGPFSGYYFKPNYLNIEAPVNSYIMAADGSKYDKVTETTEDRKLSAFRTYFEAKKAVTRAIKFSNIDSQFGEEESQDNVADNVNIYAKNHKVVITSELRSTADVRIFNTGGLCVATFNIEPGQTIETPLYSEGVYMVHVDGARFRRKLMVK